MYHSTVLIHFSMSSTDMLFFVLIKNVIVLIDLSKSLSRGFCTCTHITNTTCCASGLAHWHENDACATVLWNSSLFSGEHSSLLTLNCQNESTTAGVCATLLFLNFVGNSSSTFFMQSDMSASSLMFSNVSCPSNNFCNHRKLIISTRPFQ